ncbi:MAG TPA: peptidylprolyl isomerase [Myxococcota bacterium]|nr:peptidylprolyl isomerase [Myxococcota bacterium]
MASRRFPVPAWLALACALACVPSCKPARPSGASEAPVVAGAQDGTGDLTVARIGERLIRFGEIEDRLDGMPVFVRVRHQTTERKLEFLESFLQYTVLALEAESRGLGRDGRVIDALKDDLGERWLRRAVDLTVKTSDIPEEAVRAEYEARRLDFQRPAQARVRQVFVRDRALADKLAFRIRRTLEASDGDLVALFEGFVAQWSEDPESKRNGGSIGRFPRVGDEGPAVPDAVAAAVAAMTQPLVPSGVIEAPDGFRILLVEAFDPPVDKTLEQARPEIVADLMGRERTRLRRARLDALRTEIGVRVDEDALRRVVEGRAGRGAGDG